MKRRRARVVTLAMFAVAVCLALVLSPLRGRGAEPGAGEAGTATSRPRKGVVRKPAADDAGVSPDAGDAAVAAPSPPAGEPPDPTSIPIGRGLPVKVNVGVFFLEVRTFDDIKGEFEATTDLRLRWTDLRLGATVEKSVRGYKEYRGKEVEEQLTKLWTPTIEVTNRLEGSGYVGRRLRIFPDGRVELLSRTTSRHTTHADVATFPFDRQRLGLELIVREDTTDEVLLTFDTDDVGFSRPAREAKLDGWALGHVDLRAESVPGWNGDRYSRLVAELSVDRHASASLAPIFIPLFASLLIPLLAIWMNKAGDDGEFEVDAFELANMGIGGLFSVIALSFAVYSSYGALANGDNTVTRLFGLNYAMLAITLSIVVVCFRYNLVSRLFGRHVQREVFHFLSWALPILSLATSLAFILVAAA
ncbi:MAG: hypothetical protein KF819_16300 [Labilithrix sp.]|nr:hypothetical protein [Labilithrix sp.]